MHLASRRIYKSFLKEDLVWWWAFFEEKVTSTTECSQFRVHFVALGTKANDSATLVLTDFYTIKQ